MKKAFVTLITSSFLLLFISCVPITAGTVLVFNDTYSMDEVKSIDMNLSCESLVIENWNNDYFEVSIYSNTNQYPTIELNGKTLTGETDKSLFNWFNCKVVISVPKTFYADNWSLSTSSGSIEANNLCGDSVNVNSTSGSIKLYECGSQTMDVGATSGSINVEKCLILQSTSLGSTSGSIDFNGRSSTIESKTTSGSIDIDIDSVMPTSIDAGSTSGSIDIYLPRNDGFTFSYYATSGSIDNEFLDFHGHKSGISRYGNGACEITASATSGKISVHSK